MMLVQPTVPPPQMLIDIIGTVTSWITPKILTEGLFAPHARPGEDNLPILPCYHHSRNFLPAESCSSFLTIIEDLRVEDLGRR